MSSMEHLRDGIHLRGYGQRDPKQEYKKEGYNLFLNMIANVSSNVLTKLFEVEAQRTEDIQAMEEEAAARHIAELERAVAKHIGEDATGLAKKQQQARASAAEAKTKGKKKKKKAAQQAPAIRGGDPCPCGSGKKFKDCHGAFLDDSAA